MLGLALSRAKKRRGSLLGANIGYVSMPEMHGWATGGWVGWRWPIGRRRSVEARVGIEVGKVGDESFVPVPLGSLVVDFPL